MDQSQPKEPIRIYLDEAEEPFKEEQPPLRFNFNTIQLPDGEHVLRIEASNGLAPPTIKRIPFTVRNGVALSVSGLDADQTIGGQVELIINAYAGNTEVDFEPRKAETPTPVPTWAWVLLLGVLAWTMFYVLNPAEAAKSAFEEIEYAEKDLGERLYVDTCARCHGETGEGRKITPPDGGSPRSPVPGLRDTPNYALSTSPLKLLMTVVQGRQGTMMPAWGPIFDNDETVAVVNHIRTSWRHDASTINLQHRRPPLAIETLERDLKQALLQKDFEELGRCCWPDAKGRRRPELFRTDGVRAQGGDPVKKAWEGYFAALGPDGMVTRFELTDRRYDYERATVDQDGAIVIGMGRVFLEAKTQSGEKVDESGRFIRVYQLKDEHWALVFDFADIPMNVGCEVDENWCPPAAGAVIEDPNGGAGGVVSSDAVGFKQIQQIFRLLGRGAGEAPHEDFWNKLSYEEFCTGSFSESWDDESKLDNQIRIVVPGDVARSNLLRGLEGKPIIVTLPSGAEVERAIARMPKNGPYVADDVIAIVRRWVKDGCPETAGGKPHSSVAGGSAGGAPPPEPVAAGPTPPAEPIAAGATLGFKGVVKLIADLGAGPRDAPHEAFWTALSYKEFMEFDFTESYDDETMLDNVIKLLVPWDPDKSNLVRALEGKTLIVTLSDGSTEEHEKDRMPKDGPYMLDAGIAQIRAWIAAGCPETSGGTPFVPKPAGAGSFPAPSGPAPDDK